MAGNRLSSHVEAGDFVVLTASQGALASFFTAVSREDNRGRGYPALWRSNQRHVRDRTPRYSVERFRLWTYGLSTGRPLKRTPRRRRARRQQRQRNVIQCPFILLCSPPPCRPYAASSSALCASSGMHNQWCSLPGQMDGRSVSVGRAGKTGDSISGKSPLRWQ